MFLGTVTLIVLTIYAAKPSQPGCTISLRNESSSADTAKVFSVDFPRNLFQWFSELEAPQTFPCASEKDGPIPFQIGSVNILRVASNTQQKEIKRIFRSSETPSIPG